MLHRNSLLTASSVSSNIDDNLLISLTDKIVTLLRVGEMFAYDLGVGVLCREWLGNGRGMCMTGVGRAGMDGADISDYLRRVNLDKSRLISV